MYMKFHVSFFYMLFPSRILLEQRTDICVIPKNRIKIMFFFIYPLKDRRIRILISEACRIYIRIIT